MSAHEIIGSTATDDGLGVVVVSSVYPVPPAELWQAITSIERLRNWFGELEPDGDGSYRAALTTGWCGELVVTACEPPRQLRAELGGVEATTTVTATLAPVPGGTRLVIEERGLDVEGLVDCVAGWHAQCDQLTALLTGADAVDWRPRWEELRTQYRAAAERPRRVPAGPEHSPARAERIE